MGVKGMWAVNASALTMLIVVNLALNFASEALWIVLGLLALAVTLVFCYRQGMNLGHGACGISNTVESARKAGEKVYAQLDKKYLAQTWSVATGVKGIFASALIPYAVGGIYIALTMLYQSFPALKVPVIIARVLAWLLSLPYWPIVMHWHEDFVRLTPAIAAMLLISPFVLPLSTFLGYLRGPKLWQHTEDAMKQGRRRAKARARVGKKLVPKNQKPEI